MRGIATRSGPVAGARGDEGDGGFVAAIMQALPEAVLVVGGDDRVAFVNAAAEQFFAASRATLCQLSVSDLTAGDSALAALIGLVRTSRNSVSDHAVELHSPRFGKRRADLHGAFLGDGAAGTLSNVPDAMRLHGVGERSRGVVVVTLRERSFADTMDRQLNYRDSARSVTALAAVLAHEVKNPLSGISGAAQLLESGADENGRALTRLIRDEVDRICTLVEDMERFGDDRPLERGPVNIHVVLDHVRRLVEAGQIVSGGKRVRFVERYDPSLPPVRGNRDQLVQAVLNLVKNAVESVPDGSGEIVLATAFRHGVWIAVPGTRERLNLPLEVAVLDNGPGIPDDIRHNLFDAFVSGKPGGTGLGLALVAKIVRDHGGVIELESDDRQTVFRLRLPLWSEPAPARRSRSGTTPRPSPGRSVATRRTHSMDPAP